MLLDFAKRQDPTLLTLFKSVLGLTCQPNPTVLGFSCQARLGSFQQRKQLSQPQFLTKNTGKKHPIKCYSIVHSTNTL
jgi:hypothetical protein